jgi:hypothetical protein
MRNLELQYGRLIGKDISAEDCCYDKDNKSIIGTFNLLEEAIRIRRTMRWKFFEYVLWSVLAACRYPFAFKKPQKR